MKYLRFEVFRPVNDKMLVPWDVMLDTNISQEPAASIFSSIQRQQVP